MERVWKLASTPGPPTAYKVQFRVQGEGLGDKVSSAEPGHKLLDKKGQKYPGNVVKQELGKEKEGTGVPKCFSCGMRGHKKFKCPNRVGRVTNPGRIGSPKMRGRVGNTV